MAVTQRVRTPAAEAEVPAAPSDKRARPWWPQASWGWRAIELVVLCSFAFLQPVLAELDGQFFLAKDLVGLDVVVPVLVFALFPPGVLIAAELLVQRGSDRAAQLVHLGFVAALVTAFASGIVLRTVESGSVVQAGLALIAGAIATLVYVRVAPARSFLRVLAPAPVLFVALFLLTPRCPAWSSPTPSRRCRPPRRASPW
jgi:hypothetical protein